MYACMHVPLDVRMYVCAWSACLVYKYVCELFVCVRYVCICRHQSKDVSTSDLYVCLFNWYVRIYIYV
jgi:hypothetical protein